MTATENTQHALESIDAALKEAKESEQPYDDAEMDDIRKLQATYRARLQELQQETAQ